MQKIELEIEDDGVAQKVLWMLKHFEKDGLKIIYDEKKRFNLNIDILKVMETIDEIKNGDFSKIQTIESLENHFMELGI